MAADSSELSRVLNSLASLESGLAEVAGVAERLKNEILDFAEREAKKLKGEVLEELSEQQAKLEAETREAAEREAQEIIRRGEGEAARVKERVSKKFDDAVSLVVDVLLGRRGI
ncbi:MAG: hypothetical protein NXY59_04870 [Aigarchaeota archaeon]|nr:hypothetical protein [Candidatus Pelearchaeum maunauluense]